MTDTPSTPANPPETVSRNPLSQARLQRDLNWVLHSPSLIKASNASRGDVCWPDSAWFRQLPPAVRYDALPVPPDIHRFRLGLQFENLLACWLTHNPRYQLCRDHLQVHANKMTLGEFDFLVTDLASQQTEHWEVAVKFYLGRGDIIAPQRWFGPNTEDRLDVKYQHMMNHQLRLGETPAGQSLLAQQGLVIDRVRGFVKGRLFLPWAAFARGQAARPSMINPDHETGWWMTPADLLRLDAFADARLVWLDKPHWLSAVTAADALPAMNREELLARINNQPRPQQAIHVARVSASKREISRGFVVAEDWLAATSLPR